MSPLRLLSVLLFLTASVAGLRAQATLPTLKATLSSRTLVVGAQPVSVNLRDHFEVPTVTGSVVQFDTVLGKFNVELFGSDAPKSVTNFLSYVAGSSYTNSIIHRSAALGGGTANRIIQGGGYVPGGASITRKAPIELEYKRANARGTLAMARTSERNSATSEWFFNVDDNTTVLGASNGGGYAVFGRVLGTGMTVVDAIAALPTYNAGSVFTALPLRDMQPNQTDIKAANWIVVNKVTPATVYPTVGDPLSVLTFTASSANTGIVTTEIVASTLTLRAVAAGTTTITVRAVDTSGYASETSFPVTVVASPTFTTQPQSKAVAINGSTTVTSVATTGATYQWQRNGGNLSGTTAPGISIDSMTPTLVGLYAAVATIGNASNTSDPAIVGIDTAAKTFGSAREGWSDLPHPNTNVFDQVLLEGATGGVKSDYTINQITRMSFIDLDHDIVQVEFSGPGTLSITLDEATAPAAPTKYNQPSIAYARGHASIVITGANENTNLSIFTVGRATAFDSSGKYNILLAPNATTNNPANNGSPLFIGHTNTEYDGIADLSRISIISTNGKFGGIRAANASFYDIKGMTGIYAPGVAFQTVIYVGDINAYAAATPVFITGGVPDARVTGGDFFQDNGQPVRISGVTQLKFVQGSNSHGGLMGPFKNQAILHQNGVNVTGQVVVNPQ